MDDSFEGKIEVGEMKDRKVIRISGYVGIQALIDRLTDYLDQEAQEVFAQALECFKDHIKSLFIEGGSINVNGIREINFNLIQKGSDLDKALKSYGIAYPTIKELYENGNDLRGFDTNRPMNRVIVVKDNFFQKIESKIIDGQLYLTLNNKADAHLTTLLRRLADLWKEILDEKLKDRNLSESNLGVYTYPKSIVEQIIVDLINERMEV